MCMNSGRRYDNYTKESKLNIKKIVAIIIAIIVIVMIVIMIKRLLTSKKEESIPTDSSYYVSFKDYKWGVIDSRGKSVINPSYQELIVIPNKKKDVFLCTYNVDYETGEYKTKAINSKNEEIFKDYDQVEPVANYDESQNVWYDDQVIRVKKNEKYGLIDLDGNQIIPIEYDEITAVSGKENQIQLKKGEETKIVNSQGKDIISTDDTNQPENSESTNTTSTPEEGNTPEAQTTSPNGEVFEEDKKYGIKDKDDRVQIPARYNSITYNNDINAYIAETDDYKSSIIDNNLEERITGILLDIDNDKQYIKMRVDDEYKYYDFNLQEQPTSTFFPSNTLFLKKQDGKYGFVDKDGNVVINYQYDDATEQNEDGFAGVKKDGKWGSIDSNGKVVIEPTYNLDNYLQVDFIGVWHKGLDLNMNYYSQE